MKKALITGITGQDGSYLAELLLAKGYEVHGVVRRVALESPEQRLGRILHLTDKITLHPGSIETYPSIFSVVDRVQPDECYHLAAQSFVHESFLDMPSTLTTNIDGTLHVLSAIQHRAPHCKFYFAGSSEMFGKVEETPQTEKTRFHPRSPYGVSKVTGFEFTRNFRETYNLFACAGILFNHESPRRGFEFVTRKITHNIARIKKGDTNVLVLGNLDAKRDWGFAGDYVDAMWRMLQHNIPDDYLIATGRSHSIKQFLDLAFTEAGIHYEVIDLSSLPKKEADEEAKQLEKQQGVFVIQHPDFYRPAEVHELLGDATKAKRELGWQPTVTLEQLVQMMVHHDFRRLGLEN